MTVRMIRFFRRASVEGAAQTVLRSTASVASEPGLSHAKRVRRTARKRSAPPCNGYMGLTKGQPGDLHQYFCRVLEQSASSLSCVDLSVVFWEAAN
jgi:hypothetical protein